MLTTNAAMLYTGAEEFGKAFATLRADLSAGPQRLSVDGEQGVAVHSSKAWAAGRQAGRQAHLWSLLANQSS